MSQLVITCPIDGLPLTTRSTSLRATDVARDDHVHLLDEAQGACANGHNWRYSANIILERVDERRTR